MHTSPPSKKTRDAIIVVIALILCTVIFISRYNYVNVSHPWLLAACDALFGVGLLYIIWGIVMYATYKGGLDGLFYIARNIASIFKKDRDVEAMTYYDYISSRERLPNRFRTFLLAGGIMLVLSAVFFVLYRKFCR
ncbi:MAG: DUF3899 domain-containing protein [Oscillospiraceae bacterium]|nr:DUF3899 domain-containing protein [Oscillospiraceae bacterium]MCR5173044.1 DUF3899 domain-containing protein [Oscillospiraceae bacterium]